MARKKMKPIESLGKNTDKLIVQKSRPLFALWQSDLTLAEFKILDTYLSRIDSRKPDKRTVVFKKGELEKLLGVKRIRQEDLDERLKNLMTSIRIDDETSPKGFTRIALFEKCYADQDDYDQWQVEMTCTPSAMKYIFNIENLGYLRYKLRCITSLKSRQAYVLFMLLESNRFRTPFEIDLQELKEILRCDKEETYKEYKRFNDLVLKRIQKELHEKTECRFEYEPIKKGRSVVAIKFKLETIKEIMKQSDDNQIKGQIDIFEYTEGLKGGNNIYQEALPNDFNEEQAEVIRQIAIKKVPYDDYGALPYECVVADYIREKTQLMRAQKKKVTNEFSWIKKAVEEDW